MLRPPVGPSAAEQWEPASGLPTPPSTHGRPPRLDPPAEAVRGVGAGPRGWGRPGVGGQADQRIPTGRSLTWECMQLALPIACHGM